MAFLKGPKWQKAVTYGLSLNNGKVFSDNSVNACGAELHIKCPYCCSILCILHVMWSAAQYAVTEIWENTLPLLRPGQ